MGSLPRSRRDRPLFRAPGRGRIATGRGHNLKYEMRQSRDGAIRIIDRTPRSAEGGFATALPDAGETLVWFMRTMACVWVAKGLFNWAVLMGLNPRFGDFTMLPRALQTTIVFFA